MRVGVLTISDRVSKGEAEDRGGVEVVEALTSRHDVETIQTTVADERKHIIDMLIRWSDVDGLDAILTTGGTGLGPRDVTPEATVEVIRYRVPGIEEALRAEGRRELPAAMLSRGVAGIRGRTLIVNLPGSPRGARQGAEVVAAVLPHAVDLLHGRTDHHHPAGAGT